MTLSHSAIPKPEEKIPRTFRVIGKDFHSPLVRNEIWVSFCYQWQKLFNLPRVEVDIFSKEDAIFYITELNSWNAAKKVFQERVQANPDILATVIEQSEKWGKELNAFTRKVRGADLTTWARQDLISFHQHYAELQSRQYGVGVLLPLLDITGVSFLEEFLQTHLRKRLSNERSAEACTIFTTPTKNSFALDQEEALLTIAVGAFKNNALRKTLTEESPDSAWTWIQKHAPDFADKLRTHAKTYGWVYYVYAGPVFTEVQFVQFLAGYAKKNIEPEKELQKRKEERAELFKLRSQFFEELNPELRARKLIELTSEYVWSKPRRKDYQSRSYYDLETLYRYVAESTGAELYQVRSATQKQLAEMLSTSHADIAQLTEQFSCHFAYSTDTGVQTAVGNEALKKFQDWVLVESDDSADTNIVTGSVAFRGHAQGHVRIVNVPEDMSKMNEGDILVSIATSPSIVPAMKQATAIVSDEGGLTCHASIVSRELKKPCVVGTKIATKVFKDGDLVEVDAEKGIVRKI